MPTRKAGARARGFVDRCCIRWQLDDIADHAALIATELTANVVQHARTRFTLSVRLRQHHLQITAQDHFRAVPVRVIAEEFGGGRGLLIIEGVAAAWGCVATSDGKAVWATLRLPAGR